VNTIASLLGKAGNDARWGRKRSVWTPGMRAAASELGKRGVDVRWGPRADRCDQCGADLATRPDRLRRYCSRACQRPRLCRRPGCGQLGAFHRSYCADHGPLPPFQGPPEVQCRLCRAPIPETTGNGQPRLRRRYCSLPCQRQAAELRTPGDRSGRGAGRRFPRVRYAARLAIFERDAWRCQICGAPIDPELRFPHPGSATIDHQDPDGPHEPSNWQSAHLGCNVSKGTKLGPGADPKLRRAAAA